MQRYYGIDFRDFFREGGGASRLTYRRLMTLITYLPQESAFYSAVEDRPAISETSAAVMDIWEALANKRHPRWTALQRERDRRERERAMEAARAKAKSFNAVHLS